MIHQKRLPGRIQYHHYMAFAIKDRRRCEDMTYYVLCQDGNSAQYITSREHGLSGLPLSKEKTSRGALVCAAGRPDDAVETESEVEDPELALAEPVRFHSGCKVAYRTLKPEMPDLTQPLRNLEKKARACKGVLVKLKPGRHRQPYKLSETAAVARMVRRTAACNVERALREEQLALPIACMFVDVTCNSCIC